MRNQLGTLFVINSARQQFVSESVQRADKDVSLRSWTITNTIRRCWNVFFVIVTPSINIQTYYTYFFYLLTYLLWQFIASSWVLDQAVLLAVTSTTFKDITIQKKLQTHSVCGILLAKCNRKQFLPKQLCRCISVSVPSWGYCNESIFWLTARETHSGYIS